MLRIARIIVVSGLVGAGTVVACSGGEEEVIQQGTAVTPTADATPTVEATPELSAVAPTPTPGQRKASLPGGYELSYPGSWSEALVSESNPYIAKFVITATPDLATEYLAEFEVVVYENPQQVALQEFFDGQERPNLFKDAVEGYREFSAGGATGYWFDNVQGLSTSTVVALAIDGFVYEFGDPDQRHQSDGFFLQTVRSFKPTEG